MHANPRSVSTLCAPGVRALRVAAGTRAATGRGLLHASPEHHGLAEIPSESRYSEAPYEMRGSLRGIPQPPARALLSLQTNQTLVEYNSDAGHDTGCNGGRNARQRSMGH